MNAQPTCFATSIFLKCTKMIPWRAFSNNKTMVITSQKINTLSPTISQLPDLLVREGLGAPFGGAVFQLQWFVGLDEEYGLRGHSCVTYVYACMYIYLCLHLFLCVYNGQSTAAGARMLMGHPHTTQTPIRTTGQYECRVLAYRGGRHAAEMASRAFQVHLQWRSKGVRGCER